MSTTCRLLSAAALAALLAATAHAAPPLYHVTDLGDLPGGENSSVATGINSAGHVTGWSGTTQGFRTFLWSRGGGLQDIGTLPGRETDDHFVGDINSSGQIVGHSYSNDTLITRAFIWSSSGGMQDLGALPGGEDNSTAEGINSSGQVVGASGGRAFLWTSGLGMQDLGSLYTGDANIALAINDDGQVAGRSALHAFRWTAGGGMQDLGDLPGGADYSEAIAINSTGEVVGWSNVEGDINFHAFRWTSDAGMQDLGDLPGGGDYSSARGVNAAGQIVGDGTTGSGTHAFLWSIEDGMLDLNTLLDSSGTGWTLVGSNAINNAGQIVGGGYDPNGDFHAFLLTPIPEPAAATLAACGAALLTLASIRRRNRQRQTNR